MFRTKAQQQFAKIRCGLTFAMLMGLHAVWFEISIAQVEDLDDRILNMMCIGLAMIQQATFQPRWTVSCLVMLAHFAGLFMFRSDFCVANVMPLCMGVAVLFIADPQRPHEGGHGRLELAVDLGSRAHHFAARWHLDTAQH